MVGRVSCDRQARPRRWRKQIVSQMGLHASVVSLDQREGWWHSSWSLPYHLASLRGQGIRLQSEKEREGDGARVLSHV